MTTQNTYQHRNRSRRPLLQEASSRGQILVRSQLKTNRLRNEQSVKGQGPSPNCAVKRTPTQAMPSASSWPVLVPYAPSVLRRRLP